MLNFLAAYILIFSQAEASQFVVWNVGQGQWSTEIHPNVCLHFDLGGEINVVSKVLAACYEKQNILFLSHWDWDHISWAPRFAAKAKLACLDHWPAGPTTSWKKNFLRPLPLCNENIRKMGRTFVKTDFDGNLALKTKKKWKPNDLSQVLEARSSRILIPGDSPLSQELKWRSQVSTNIRGLILSHHGSKTSTSKALLERLNLKWAVASARKKKYGHPHMKVIEILKAEKVPLLRTEDWGHLHFDN